MNQTTDRPFNLSIIFIPLPFFICLQARQASIKNNRGKRSIVKGALRSF
jgi:hypothetical protein